MDKRPLKECNGSREAVHIQTWYFLLASPKKEQTNKQKKQTEGTLTGHRNSCGQLQRAGILIKRQEILKNTAIQEKLQLYTTGYWTRQGTSTITF